jgi:hypothetical protein
VRDKHDVRRQTQRGRISYFTLIALVNLLPADAALANGPEIGWNAGTIIPVASQTVQLVSESVLVCLPSSLINSEGSTLAVGTAECSCVLRNLSASPQEFEMSFLESGPSRSYREPGFRVLVDNHPVHMSLAKTDRARWSRFEPHPPDSLPVWKVSINSLQEATVIIHFLVSWSGSNGYLYFRYYARPAALWADSIEYALIEFRIDETRAEGVLGAEWQCTKRRVEPAGHNLTPTGVLWALSNWEPASDFLIGLHCTTSANQYDGEGRPGEQRGDFFETATQMHRYGPHSARMVFTKPVDPSALPSTRGNAGRVATRP